jgi:hypothetical protein
VSPVICLLRLLLHHCRHLLLQRLPHSLQVLLEGLRLPLAYAGSTGAASAPTAAPSAGASPTRCRLALPAAKQAGKVERRGTAASAACRRCLRGGDASCAGWLRLRRGHAAQRRRHLLPVGNSAWAHFKGAHLHSHAGLERSPRWGAAATKHREQYFPGVHLGAPHGLLLRLLGCCCCGCGGGGGSCCRVLLHQMQRVAI